MELTQALKAGILPSSSSPVEIILTANKEGLQDMVQKQIIKHHELLHNAKDADDARHNFLIENDLSEGETVFLNNLRIWTNKTFLGDKLKLFLKNTQRKKIYRPIDDSSITHCSKCGTRFNFYTRKHHCRSCGKIFCYNCSQWLENIPRDLVEYVETYNWITEDKVLRVCQACKESINSYRRLERLIQYFEIVSYPLELCLRALTLSKDWCDAMKIYLANFRQIQNYSPTIKLSKRDICALQVNIDNIQGHNKWLLQALKIGLVKNNGLRKLSCSEMLCEHNCSDELTVFDSLILLNTNEYSAEVRLFALKILEQNKFPDDITLFLPIENPGIQEFILKRPDVFMNFFWSSRINQGFNMDMFRNKLLLANPEQGRDAQESLRLISYLDQHHSNLYELSCSLQSLATPFIGPFGPIERFDHDITIKNSATRPIFVSYMGNGHKQAFLYKREDIRKDSHIVALIRIMYYLCSDIFDINGDEPFLNLPVPINIKNSTQMTTAPVLINSVKQPIILPVSFPPSSDLASDLVHRYNNCDKLDKFNKAENPKYLVTYRVVPISIEAGFIEIVPNASTLSHILQKGSISNYLYRSNSNKKVSEISSNYSASLAFWTVVTYILGVGDRHQENIMIRDDGVLFHIDYGFVFGADTISSVIRLDANLIEGLGGSEMYKPFKVRCQDIFCCLRRHFNLISSCLLRLSSIEPRIKNHLFTQTAIEQFVASRFLFGQSEKEAKEAFSNIIDSNRETLIHKVSDVIHSTVSNFKVTWWS